MGAEILPLFYTLDEEASLRVLCYHTEFISHSF